MAFTYQAFQTRIDAADTVKETEYVRNKYLALLQDNKWAFNRAVNAYRLSKIDLMVGTIITLEDLNKAISYVFEALAATKEPTPKNMIRNKAWKLLLLLTDAKITKGEQLLGLPASQLTAEQIEEHIEILKSIDRAVMKLDNVAYDFAVERKVRATLQLEQFERRRKPKDIKEAVSKVQRWLFRRIPLWIAIAIALVAIVITVWAKVQSLMKEKEAIPAAHSATGLDP